MTNLISSEQQSKAVETLGEWSKWLIGITFGAATGCMMILEGGVSARIKPHLVAAIFFLAVSILFSVLLFLVLPSIIQKLPLKTTGKKSLSIFDYQVLDKFPLRYVLVAQIASFVLGIIFLLIWVMLKPAGK